MNKKVILITGGTGGIGKAAAIGLAQSGAQVIITGRNLLNAEKAVAEIKSISGQPNVSYLLADMASLTEVNQLATSVASLYNRLDVLINNGRQSF